VTTPEQIVIVGGGLAAANAVEALRERSHAGRLTLVGRERRLPYERPPLSKELLKGDQEFEVAHDEAWYAERDVELHLGEAVAAIDADAGEVVLGSDRRLPFDRLLLATGARPRVPDLPGVEHAVTLRTVEDSLALRDRLGAGGTVALVGGGWIGLEVAAAAVAHGGRAVVLERDEAPLGRVLGPRIASYLVDLHRGHGVDVRTGVTVESIGPDGVRTSAGLVEAGTVVLAVGAVPETALAEAAGLAIAAPEQGGGIVVDEHLRTSDPRVFAAGDVANALNVRVGQLRVEHWDNAIRQGQLAAATMLGEEDAVYDWLPYFFTDQFEFSMEYVGHSAPGDEVVVRGDLAAHEFIAYWLRDRVVTAAMNVGIWDVNDRLRELVGQRVDPGELTDLRQ